MVPSLQYSVIQQQDPNRIEVQKYISFPAPQSHLNMDNLGKKTEKNKYKRSTMSKTRLQNGCE